MKTKNRIVVVGKGHNRMFVQAHSLEANGDYILEGKAGQTTRILPSNVKKKSTGF